MASSSPVQSASGRKRPPESLRGQDWAATPLGPAEAWPASLRFAHDICLHSALPAAILWGPERLQIYNDAWLDLAGGRAGLGRPAADSLGPLWAALEPAVGDVEASGEGRFLRELPLTLPREGHEEEGYWNISLLPVGGEDGGVAGILCQANDVTKTVTVERRLSFQVMLADRLRGLGDPGKVKSAATRALGEYLGASRVGYAEIDEAHGTISVHEDWTRDEMVSSLAGQSGVIAAFGEEALAFLRSGEVLAIPDIRALPLVSARREAAWQGLGVRALITVPLVRDGVLKALLYVHEPVPRAWKRSEAAMARDVAERTWSAVERALAEQSLRDSEDHYRHTVELNPQVTWTALPDGRLNRVAGRWQEWTGVTGLGDSWSRGIHPDDRRAIGEAWSRSVAAGEPYDAEHRVRHRDGSYRWARSRAFPRRDPKGRIRLWYGTTEDIHERKVAEEHQRLLINELNHRVKNNLATVQAIALQTLKGDIPLAEARARFEARLMALSRAHNLLTEQNWGGASLKRVVVDATEHLAAEPGRFTIAGDPLRLSPRAALALALALHELGTNAAKYGALSVEGGEVAIAWQIGGGRLALEWKEKGGPPVAEPRQRGFGSRLIERGLEADLGGGARLVFEPDGLRCVVDASLDAICAREAGLG
jgi:PAS domain S-box-containing protein